MSDRDLLEPLEPGLRDLLARERGAYSDDPAARDAVLRRLQAAIVLAPLAAEAAVAAKTGVAAGAAGAKAGAAGTAVLGWKGAVVLGLVAFGSGITVGEVHRAWSPVSNASLPPGRTASRMADAEPHTSSSATVPETPSIPASSLPAAPPAGSSSAPSRANEMQSTGTDASEERALIDTARSALARGLPRDALSAVERHAKRFPKGRLAEEREALAVQALARSGDQSAARARAARFRRAYPDSIFAATVERAVSSLEEKDASP